MKFHSIRLPGVMWIEPEPYRDERGLFRRHFCQGELAEAGLSFTIGQTNISENNARHTLRGLHCQAPPHGEAKILSCLRGAIHDIVVDLRVESPTYGQWDSFTISADNRCLLHVPLGCANGFLTLEENTWIHYYHSGFYEPCSETNIRYNDPYFQFDWPALPAVISEKDRAIPDFVPLKPI